MNASSFPFPFAVVALAACNHNGEHTSTVPEADSDTGTPPAPIDTGDTSDTSSHCGDGLAAPDEVCFESERQVDMGAVVPFQVAVADWDGGGLDLIIGTDAGVAVLSADGSGGFTAPVDLPLPDIEGLVVELDAGDLNGDGFVDVTACDAATYARIAYGDGLLDLAVATSMGIVVYRNAP